MNIANQLYIGKCIKQKEKVITRLQAGKFVPGLYLLTIPHQENAGLEIIQAALFSQEYFHKSQLLVVGIAIGYVEALELVQQITEDAFEQTNDADLRRYLLNRQLGN